MGALATFAATSARAATRGEIPGGALVMGGAHGSLGVVRSLGRHGIPVWVLTSGHPLARFSRFATKGFSWPGPGDPRALAYLLELAEKSGLRGWVLFPGGDAEARLIALHHDALAQVYRLITPPWETLRWAADKSLTYRLAAEIGVDCPRTFHPGSRADLARIRFPFPMILKPTSRNVNNALTRAKAWRVDDDDALAARYDEAVAMMGAESVLVQELIPGDGTRQFSYAAVCDGGKPIGSLTARRRRQYPIDFGFTSTFVESIENSAVEEAACRFLKATSYSGLIELEFKYDPREDKYKLLDVNARAWAWLSLGGKAGVDFPWLMWKLILGEPIERARGRAGCAWVHASRDLASAFAELRAGSFSLSAYLRSLRRSELEFAAFSYNDFLPGLVDLPLALTRFCRR